jgi:hypothetical protein
MDILTGDPFYHNIIYHLSIKDLYNLIKTSKHFAPVKSYIKPFTLNDIKCNLALSLGNKYDMFKIKFQIMAEKLNNHENYLIKFHKKKYSSMLDGQKFYKSPENSTRFNILSYQTPGIFSNKGQYIDIRNTYGLISASTSSFSFKVYGLKNSDIECAKSNFKSFCDGRMHTYLIENNGKSFDLNIIL